jgi:tRNA G26 N,N-dimethylase Trm1
MAFINRMNDFVNTENCPLQLHSEKKIKGMFHAILLEKELADIPYSYHLNRIGKFIHTTLPNQHVFM